MDLKKLEYLLQVAEYGSFTKAAAVIGIAQPALGRQVQKLEEECGVRLLYRHGRGVVLTPEGESLVERVRPLVRQLQQVTSDVRNDAASVAGSVTLGMTPTAGALIGIPLVTSLRAKYPKLQMHVMEAYSGYVHEWLIAGRLDVAILHDARRSQQLLVEPLAMSALSLVSPAGSRQQAAARGRPLPLRRLKEFALVLPTRNHGLRRALDYAASRAGVPLDVQFEVDTLRLAVDMVRNGLAHTVLAYPMIEEEERRGEVQFNRIASPEVHIRLMMARAANRPYTRAVQLLEAEIREQIRAAMVRHARDLVPVDTEPQGRAPARAA